MKNMKFKIKNEAHSKAIQERLFEMGYRYSCANEKKVQYLGYPFLFVDWNGINVFANDKLPRHIDAVKTTLDELYENKEFNTTLAYNHNGSDVSYYAVTEIKNNFLNIGCSKIDVRSLKKLIKEYDEFKS